MFDFFRKKSDDIEKTEPAASTVYPTAPGTEIHYSPDLVAQLKGEHGDLLQLYGAIQEAFGEGDFAQVSTLLGKFRGKLQGHLLTENVRLYIYLDRCFSRDDTNSELIREFRREMDGIGKTVMNFLKKYDAIGVDRDLAPSFKKDFDALGGVLVERIQREETTLYPLYLPAY